jgi:PAS domain S-box-containing protein
MERASSRQVMFCFADEQYRLRDADPEFVDMIGLPREQLMGRNALDFTHVEDRPVYRSSLEGLLSHETPFSITKRYVAASGAPVWVTNHVSSFHMGRQRMLMATVELLSRPAEEDRRRVLRVAAERILAKRRLRTQFFEEALFGEPAFDILLDLFVQEQAGRETCTTSAAVAAGAALTTALRQIAWLVDRGFVLRTPDPHDRRRTLLHLTALGQQTMWDYLGAAERI